MGSNKLKDRFEKLDSMPSTLSPEDARRRGTHFENLMLDLFEKHGMLLRRSYHTSDGKSEQVDGAIRIDGRLTLVESKWVKSQLAASDLFAFSGKVDGKFIGTIGLFVSRNALSENFLAALRTGRRQAVLVVHGQDIEMIFDDSFPLKDYLQYCLEACSVDNVSHYPASKYIKDLVQQSKVSAPAGIPEEVENELRESYFDYISDEVADKIEDAQVIEVYKTIITSFKSEITYKKLDPVYRDNLISLGISLKKRLPGERVDADWILFDNVSKDFLTSPLKPFVKYFAERLPMLTDEERTTFYKRLVKQWNIIIGNYDKENDMAEITKPLYAFVDEDTRVELLSIFITFVISSRWPRYPQYRLAEECIKTANKNEIRKATVSLLRRNIHSWLEGETLDEFTDRDRRALISWQCQEYGKLSKIVTVKIDVKDIVEKLVDEVLDELRKTRKVKK